MPAKKLFNFLDVCSGIGGFRLGLESLGGRCVGRIDNDEYANRVYDSNFPVSGEYHAGDIGMAQRLDIGRPVDVLVAGFPCQPFSRAGRMKGMEDPRANVFGEIVRLLRELQPMMFILENVPNLKYINDGCALHYMGKMLHDAGYSVGQSIICASHWVPQRRKRLFIWGMNEDLAMSCCLNEYMAQLCFLGDTRPVIYGRCLQDLLDKYVPGAYYLSKTALDGVNRRRERPQFKYSIFNVGDRDLAPTITCSVRHGTKFLINDGHVRFPTPQECLRLMGFDDICKEMGRMPYSLDAVSRSRAYRLVGNTVCPQAVRCVASVMMEAIGDL